MSQETPMNQIDVGPFILADKNSAQEIYTDGVSQVLLGYPVSRVVLHSILEPATPQTKEIRRAAVVLTMPTITLIETAQLILQVCKQEGDELSSFNTLHGNKLREILAAGIESTSANLISKT